MTHLLSNVILIPAALAEAKPMCASGNNLPSNIVLDKELTDPTLRTAQPVMLHRPGRSVPTAGLRGMSVNRGPLYVSLATNSTQAVHSLREFTPHDCQYT